MIIDQGTILYGFRSEKYPEICCYAIIISASCDIANHKIPKYYYLTAVDAKQWFCTKVGYEQVYNHYIQNLKSGLKTALQTCQLNVDLICELLPDQVSTIFNAVEMNRKQRRKLDESYAKFHRFSDPGMDYDKRKALIAAEQKCVLDYLGRVSKGEILHYYYLPNDTYLEHGTKADGLIVDLQEIGYLSVDDVKKIATPGIDYLCVQQNGQLYEDRDRLSKQFWLRNENDFVDVEGAVDSPWREHLMQRFSNGFIRIGVDGAREADYKRLVEKICEG